MTVESIKQAITQLSDEDRDSLASWIIEQEYDHWDKEMVKDFSSDRRGEHLVEQLNREIEFLIDSQPTSNTLFP